ncbi:protein NO VEIN domain-containing protein [Bacteroides fragilis]
MFIGSQALSNTGADINSGELGEKIVYVDLCERFGEERVHWTSSYNPKVSYGTPEYDFEIFTEDLNEILYYIDAKSTTTKKGQSDKTEIFWRNSEWNFIETKNPNNYLIARVFNCNSDNYEIVYLEIKKKDLFTI